MSKWSEEQIQYLKDNIGKINPKEMSKVLNKSTNSIKRYRQKLGISNNNGCPSKISKEYLIEHYTNLKKTSLEISEELKCGYGTVNRALKKYNIPNNGIKKSLKQTNKTYEEITGSYYSSIKHSARRRHIEFNVNIEYLWELFLKQDRKCVFTDLELVFGKKATASLDRKDSSIGYTESNIQWVHKDINMIKMSFTNKEFIDTCKEIINNYDNNILS